MSQRVHVLGVGKMGLPMAIHLRAAGHAVSVSDPDPQRLTLARQQGLQVVEEASVGIGQAEVVLSSLPNDAALLTVAQQVADAAHFLNVLILRLHRQSMPRQPLVAFQETADFGQVHPAQQSGFIGLVRRPVGHSALDLGMDAVHPFNRIHGLLGGAVSGQSDEVGGSS